ncbi:hypothetical protein [Limoniibacter endophyticus]|uniref:Uncharacterized protein n=1 Tax=Limoniibacter endophyticus TaxID=1565040 RepID=A0A8J3DG21_9HYPH|nr:hypothetical protein [Limoniibacter endophyticus]GHC63060.1 hypothetical protein GCM10010136_04550 [Limoniibacter endophyticus]
MQTFENRTVKVSIFGRKITLPRSRLLRISLGIAFVIGGLLGFLPILGFWMIPVGLLILSYDFASIRRRRRRSTLWWHRKIRRERAAKRGRTP